jgi:hypothetical protein
MTTKILNFRKTDHFLYRQWDRKVDDILLGKILPYVNGKKNEKEVTIVFSSFLKKSKIKNKNNNCFILITKGAVILTCYWCDNPEYLYYKEKNAKFQILF